MTEHPESSGDAAVAARLARRYPSRRIPRWFVIAAVIVVAALGVGWVVWTGARFATPAVSGRLDTFAILSDGEAAFSITMERPDPSTVMICRVIAQADDFERVGELDVSVPAGTGTRVVVDDRIKTFRRATSVSLDGCRSG